MTQMAARSARSGAWLADPGFGVYVHIPFCVHRCGYCDFNTYALGEPQASEATQERYVDALCRDIERSAGTAPEPATSVFFGGGTPTLLQPASLARILGAVRSAVGIAPDAEITIEANPETIDERYVEGLLEAGFGRISIGVQSLVPSVLSALGRAHSPEVALEALRAARAAGAGDLSADLIYGAAGESDTEWRSSIEGVLEAGVDHVSAYALTIEAGTPLAVLVGSGRAPGVDPDVQAARAEMADEILSGAGFGRYEISNWTTPGRASRHNLLYWSAGEYLGFGAGAHGHLSGRRYWNVRLPRDFCELAEAGRGVEAGAEALGHDERAAEALMLGLRLVSGIDEAAFERRWESQALASRAEAVRDLVALGLLERVDGWLKATPRGLALGSEVATRLL